MRIDEQSCKWMVVKLELCTSCKGQVRHNVGVHYPEGKEEGIRECLRCHTISPVSS